MDIVSSLAIVALAALIHASFQLSVSVLTLMSGHSIGAKRSNAKLIRLTGGFIFGSVVMTMLAVSFVSLVLLHLTRDIAPNLLWTVGCGLLLGIGISIWLFYYRRGKGTLLWVPRGMARYLGERSKVTARSAEAFGLGLSSVLGELLFIIGPIFISGLVLITLPPVWQLVGIGLYTLVASLSLLIVGGLIGSGHTLSRIQRWRETNKRFLQFAAGSGLLVLSFYVYVSEVLPDTVSALSGGL